MRRLLAIVLAGWLSLSATAASAATRSSDFIAAMTVPLAIDPAAADARADRELARIGAVAARDADAAAAHWVKAQAGFRLGDAAAARQALSSARRLAPDDRAGRRVLAYVALLDGLLARGDGDLAAALIALRRAQQGFIAVGDRRGHALSVQSLGLLYNDAGNAAEAVRYFGLAEEIFDGDDVFRLSLNNNFGVALLKLSRYSESERRLRLARESAQRLGIDPFVQQIGLNIAANQAFAGRLIPAAQSLAAFMEGGGPTNAWQQSEVHRIRAIIAWRGNRRATAIAEARNALAAIDTATSDTTYWPMHYAAYQIFSAYGLRDEAFAQLEAVRRLEQAEAELTASNRAALLSAQFQFAAQNTQIAQLKADNLEREVSFQRTMTVTIVIGAALALGLLASLLVTAIRARNRAREDGAELAVVNQRLETALAAKTEFLASTSHELRTPLNGILGMAQILLADNAIAPRHRTQIELLHDAGSTMRALVDDILDVAKIEHGGFTIAPKPTDIGALAERVVRLFAAQAQTAGLTLDLNVVGDSPQAMVDPDRLTQILFNLIGNAIKFTPEGVVEVTVSTSNGDAPALHLAVRDSGIGIAPEWHESVFDMFRQVDGARTRNYGGTGLGLAICRQLARAMGGDIALDSAPGEGSVFTVTLPWNAVPALDRSVVPLRPVTAAVDNASPAADSVVVVGNDPMRLAMLTAIIRRSGRHIVVADTSDKIVTAMAGKCLTLLVDASAWPLFVGCVDQSAGNNHRTIIVGDSGGEVSMLHASGVRVVAFSRNAVLAVLRAPLSPIDLPHDEHSALPASADIAIGPGSKGSEPKRSALMSRK